MIECTLSVSQDMPPVFLKYTTQKSYRIINILNFFVYFIYAICVHVQHIPTTQTRGPWALTLCFRTNLAIAKFHIAPFLPQRSKLSLFSPYEQRFLRYDLIFKIAIIRHETWPLAKVPEVAYILPFYPRGQNRLCFVISFRRIQKAPKSGWFAVPNPQSGVLGGETFTEKLSFLPGYAYNSRKLKRTHVLCKYIGVSECILLEN